MARITGVTRGKASSRKSQTTKFTGFVKDFPKDEPPTRDIPPTTVPGRVTSDPVPRPPTSSGGRGRGGGGQGSSPSSAQFVPVPIIIKKPIVIPKRTTKVDTSRMDRARRLSVKQRQLALQKRIFTPTSKRLKRRRILPKTKKVKRKQFFDVFGKSGKRFVKLNKGSLTKNDALSKGAFIIDHTISRIFKISPSKSRKVLSLGKKEKNYFKRKRFKLKKITKGEKFTLKKKYTERKKYKKDTKGEKRKLTINKLLKRRR